MFCQHTLSHLNDTRFPYTPPFRPWTCFSFTVPTPIDDYKRPDRRPRESASRTVGRAIARGGVAIYESTVYPGATEEVCVPILEAESGLVFNEDFFAGY